MADQSGRRIIVCCSCGWGLERPSVRGANSAFFIHQLTSEDRGDHVSFVQDMSPRFPLHEVPRSPISLDLEGEVAE